MVEIRVPTLGESVTEATIGKWFKHPGDAVAVDEPLVELETDKVTSRCPRPPPGCWPIAARTARRWRLARCWRDQGWRDQRRSGGPGIIIAAPLGRPPRIQRPHRAPRRRPRGIRSIAAAAPSGRRRRACRRPAPWCAEPRREGRARSRQLPRLRKDAAASPRPRAGVPRAGPPPSASPGPGPAVHCARAPPTTPRARSACG